MDINKFVADKIKYYRSKRNLTLEQVAEFLNTTPQSISRYEKGERKTNQDILFKLSKLFKVSINDFFPPRTENEKIANNLIENNLSDFNYLKNALIKNGFIKDNDELTDDDLIKLLEFAKANQNFIKREKK